MTNFWKQPFKKIGEALGGAAKIVAPIAGVAAAIPGPWQLPGQIISTIGALTGGSSGGGGSSNIQADVNRMMQQGADAQMAYQMAALQQYQNNMDRQLVTATADKQMAYDVSRGQYLANQGNALPYQQASLSALQSLPMLQQLLGVPAYNVDKTINQYTPPDINYANLYSGQMQQMGGQQAPAQAQAQQSTGLPPNLRVQMRADDAPVQPANLAGSKTLPAIGRPVQLAGETVIRDSISGQTQGSAATMNPSSMPVVPTTERFTSIPTTEQVTQKTLTPYTGPAYDLNNSPLFQWQKKIADESLTAQLAASGLSDSTYAQRELSRQNQAITAAERERVVGNLQSLTSLGMGGSQLGQAQFSTPQMGGVSDIYGNAAQQLAAFQGNMGAIQGQLAAQQAQNAMAAYNAQAKQPSGIQTALEMASSFGWLGGGNKSSSSGSFSVAPYSGYADVRDLQFGLRKF